MRIPIEFLLISSGAGAIQSGFFSIYLFYAPNTKKISLKLLAFLLLASTIRMVKSISYYFPGYNPLIILESIGFASHIAIAPLLYFYIRSFVEKDFYFKKVYWFHFIPAFLVLIFTHYLGQEFWFGKMQGYLISFCYFGIYLPFIFHSIYTRYKNKKQALAKDEIIWLLILTIGITLVWTAYAAYLVFGLLSCIIAPFIFSCLIYTTSFFALTHHKMFLSDEPQVNKYKDSALTQSEIKNYANQIEDLVITQKGYRDSSISLSKLAEQIGVSKHTISEVINRHFQMSFANFINTYRLQEAKEKLKDPKNKNKKIASVAYECGFGTVAAFNTLFKKHTQMTPSAYKNKFLKNNIS